MRERVDVDRLLELVRLHRMGTEKREVARLLRLSPTTEREYRKAIEKAGLLEGSPDELPSLDELKKAVNAHRPPSAPPQQVSSVEPHRDRIVELVEDGLEARAIYDRLRLEKKDFRGSYDAVKRLAKRIRGARPISADDVAIPVVTAPGKVGQVDFGEVCHLYDPETNRVRRAWVFVLVLGFSRVIAARITFDQKIETWLRVHAECFEELGGVVETTVPDNLKSAVVRAAFGVTGEPVLNRSYREFARHFHFKIDPTPAYSPEKKGKVESGVRYVKRNFFKGVKAGANVEEVRSDLARWVSEIANTRDHGTTHRRPIDLFEAQERAALLPLPRVAFQPARWARADVHRDSHVSFESHLYSVPWRLLKKTVFLRAVGESVEVYFDDIRVATHRRGAPGGRTTLDEHLPEGRRDFRHRDRDYWEERAERIGAETLAYVKEVFDSDDVLYQVRAVQQIVIAIEAFPRDRGEAACRRARFFGNYTASGLKNILRRGLDLEPLPIAVVGSTDGLDRPRFARNWKELLQQTTEETNEPN